jgi:hypothetical protein
MCSGRVGSFRSPSDTSYAIVVTIPVISDEWGKERIVITTNETGFQRPIHGCGL